MNVTFKKTLFAAVLGVAAAAALAHGYAAGDLKIDHPWARMTVPGQVAGGAYLSVQNNGSSADRLLGASTPAAAQVQMHTMTMDGNVMKMREVDRIDIPPGQTVTLEPGRLHLMLIGLKAPLKADSRVPMSLKFEKAGTVQVELTVEAMAPGAAASARQH